MKRVIVLIVFIALGLAACAGGQTPALTQEPAAGTEAPSAETAAPSPTPLPAIETPEGGHIPVDLPPAQLKALEALAARLGINAGEIRVVEAEAVDWPDGCLGVRRMGVLCAQGIVPGFRVVLEAGGQMYEYHTNQDGSVVVEAALGSVGGEDAGEKIAIQMLSEALGIPAEEIQVVAHSSVEWPDACLGVARPGIACAEVLTPGSSIVLEAGGVQYEFHTNADASVVVPATLALTWHREGGIAGFCDDLTVILPDSVYTSSCGSQPDEAEGSLKELLSDQERAQLDTWLAQYGEVKITIKDPATADAMTTTLYLHGRGDAQPTQSEQEAMLAWAQTLFERL